MFCAQGAIQPLVAAFVACDNDNGFDKIVKTLRHFREVRKEYIIILGAPPLFNEYLMSPKQRKATYSI